jgi:threonine dehydrogenase-like Zn-dependent dehydrogenase
LQEALRLVRPLGTVVLKSTYEGKAEVNLTPLVVNEITVVGSRCGPFAPALRLLAAGQVQVEPLIAATYPLSQVAAALAHAAQPDVRKVLLRP